MWRIWASRREEEAILVAIANGGHLKVHRTIDGDKVYKLYLSSPASIHARQTIKIYHEAHEAHEAHETHEGGTKKIKSFFFAVLRASFVRFVCFVVNLLGFYVQERTSEQNEIREVNVAVVTKLCQKGWIESNMKFPVASYLLTEKGMSVAQRLAESSAQPVLVRT